MYRISPGLEIMFGKYNSFSEGNSLRKPKVKGHPNQTCECVLSHFSCVWLFATPWTAGQQAPLSVGFSRQEYWSGLLFLPPGNLPNPGIEPSLFTSPALAGKFFTSSATWEPQNQIQTRLNTLSGHLDNFHPLQAEILTCVFKHWTLIQARRQV